MKKCFRIRHFLFKLNYEAIHTWMCGASGNGELESDNQGRSARTSFSQETVGKNKVQYWPRIGLLPALLKSAGCTKVSDSSSLFSFFHSVVVIPIKIQKLFLEVLSFAFSRQRCVFVLHHPAGAATRIRNTAQKDKGQDLKKKFLNFYWNHFQIFYFKVGANSKKGLGVRSYLFKASSIGVGSLIGLRKMERAIYVCLAFGVLHFGTHAWAGSNYKIQKELPLNPREGMTQSQIEMQQKQKLRQAAQMYEEQFLNTMVAQMRKTVPESELLNKSYAETYFENQLDQKYVEGWTKKGGIGLADLVYNQLEQRIFGANANTPQPPGPMEIDKKQALPVPSEEKPKFELDEAPSGDDSARIDYDKAQNEFPFVPQTISKTIVSQSKLSLGEQRFFKVSPNNVTKLFFGFAGQSKCIQWSDVLRPGQQLGKLINNADGLMWSVRKRS